MKLALIGGHMIERNNAFVRLLIRKGDMSMTEGSTAYILTAQANVVLCIRKNIVMIAIELFVVLFIIRSRSRDPIARASAVAQSIPFLDSSLA